MSDGTVKRIETTETETVVVRETTITYEYVKNGDTSVEENNEEENNEEENNDNADNGNDDSDNDTVNYKTVPVH